MQTIVNGEASHAGGVPPGETARRRDALTGLTGLTRLKQQNHLLRRARLARRSPSGLGHPMSRQELADAVNAWVYAASGHIVSLDANYVGKLERGLVRWPSAKYRSALCAILGAARPADLGFHIVRQGTDPDVADLEPHVLDRTPVQPVPSASLTAGAGGMSTALNCTVAATDSGGIRIVVELAPAQPGTQPVVEISGSAVEVYVPVEASA